MDSEQSSSKPFIFPVMKKAIEDLFTKSSITKEDIESFQDRYWEQLVPNFSQALKLLDIHGVPRHNILWSINDRLLEAIKSNVDAKSFDPDQKKCQKLWQKLIKTGMVYIHHPYMRSLIMQVLGKMNAIKERHVNLIVDNKNLYADAPLPVLRHIWVAHPLKFQEELDKVIAQLQSSWSDALLEALSMSIMSKATSTSDLVPLLYWPPRRRRRDAAIVRMAEMIGDNEILYEKTVKILWEECVRSQKTAQLALEPLLPKGGSSVSNTTDSFLSPGPPAKRRRRLDSGENNKQKITLPIPPSPVATPFTPLTFLPNNPSVAASTLCTLRFDLLMSLNEAKIDRLCANDRVHRFIWCLDACVRNKRIDQRHASGLGYHLRIQRHRMNISPDFASTALLTDDPADKNDSSSSAKKHATTTGGATKVSKRSRMASKRPDPPDQDVEDDDPDDASGDGKYSAEAIQFERGVHMACRDPWSMYTVCTSLIRYVLHGLYEDKLPRDIPEVHLLVHLLLLGLGDDFQLHSSIVEHKTKDKSGSKGVASALDSFMDDNIDSSKSISSILLNHILPSIAQLQALVWRAQVAEEILTASNNIWPGSGNPNSVSGSLTSTSSPITVLSLGETRRGGSSGTTSESSRESDVPPTVYQKHIANALESSAVTVPPGYFAHPVGYLLLQYHALFALERQDLTTLRCLLKIASGVAQQQSRINRSTTISTPGKGRSGLGSPTSPMSAAGAPSMPSCPIVFRWRPEILQCLVLGIARLPSSAPAFVDAGRNVHSGSSSGASGFVDSSGPQMDLGTGMSDSSNLDRQSISVGISKTVSGSDTGSSTSATNLTPTKTGSSEQNPSTNVAMINRSELASLLRASLPLINDVQLLALAQIALLVPGTTLTSTSSSSGLSTSLPADGQPEPNTPTLSERERLVNTLSRHCLQTADPIDTADSANVGGGCYKSSNPRVLQVLELLRKDVDRTVSTNPLTLYSGNFIGSKSLGTVYQNQATPYIGSGIPSSANRLPAHSGQFRSTTPESPTPLVKYSGGAHVDVKSHPIASSSIYPQSNLPIGTPLTNPGLAAATPNINNLSLGQFSMPTPRRPSTPPREFRPSSSSGGDSLNHFSERLGFDAYSSCPSPSVHRTSVPTTDCSSSLAHSSPPLQPNI